MIVAYLLEYILVTTAMLACFLLYKYVAKKTISMESVKILLRGSFLSFIIVMAYTSVIALIVKLYGSEKTPQVMTLVVLIFNVTVNVSLTVFYYILKTRDQNG